MVPADLAPLAVAKPSWAVTAPSLIRRQVDGECVGLVATVGADRVGLAELMLGEVPELRNVHVLEAWRGRGVGTAILAAAERSAAGSGTLQLAVADDNPRARSLYERLGFMLTGEQRRVEYQYVDDTGLLRDATEVDLVMQKDLR